MAPVRSQGATGTAVRVSSSLLGLPIEIFQCIANKMTCKDKAALLQTCKDAYALTARPLYHRLYTKRGAACDVTALPDFLARRPELIPLIDGMVIDEYDEAAFRRLLSIQFPNLESILMQHRGDVEKTIPDGEKQLLNKSIKPQPKIRNLTFNISPVDRSKNYSLTLNDLPLFDHSTITRLRLSYLDFSAMEDVPPSTFTHTDLDTFDTERCILPPKFYTTITSPSKVLTHCRLDSEPSREPITWMQHPLSYHARTLKLLKLVVPCEASNPAPLDLSSLTSLRVLQIHPKFLLGPTYDYRLPVDSIPFLELFPLLRATLPPHLVVLLLDNLFPKVLTQGIFRDMVIPITPLDEHFIETLLVHRQELCPYLIEIGIYYCSGTADSYVYDLAEKHGVCLKTLENKVSDLYGPSIEIIERVGPNIVEVDDSDPPGGRYTGLYGGRTNPFGTI